MSAPQVPESLNNISQNQYDLLHWAQENIVNEKKHPFEMKAHGYMKDIYQSWDDEMVIKKSAQVGATFFAIVKTIWLATHNNVTVIFTMPKGGDISNFSQARRDPIIKNSTLPGMTNDISNVGLIQLGGSFIYFKGTWGTGDAISVPSDFNIHDEVDFSNPEVLEAYKERLSGVNSLGWQLHMSTPSYPDYGIDELYQQTNQNEWVIKCPNNHEQILSIKNIIDNKYVCTVCGTKLNRTNGRWVPQNPSSNRIGYHPTQLMVPWISAEKIIDKKNKYKYKRDFINFVLGETYAGGKVLVTSTDIKSCLGEISAKESGTYKTCFGVDWGDVTWIVIRQGNEIVDMVRIGGDTRTHAQQVIKVIDKFENPHGVLDFGYGDGKNKDILERYNKGENVRFWMCKFQKEHLYAKFHIKKQEGTEYEMPMVNVDRSRAIEETLMEKKDGEVIISPTPMLNTFIEHYKNIIQEITHDKHGRPRIVYNNTGDDHLVLADTYSRLLNLREDDEEEEDEAYAGTTDWDVSPD